MSDEVKQPKHAAGTKGSRKILDVVPPNTAPAGPTSRPVILGHKTVADDQFVANAPLLSGDAPEKRDLLDAKKKIAIDPVSDNTTSGQTAEGTAEPSTVLAQPKDDAPAVSATPETSLDALEESMAHMTQLQTSADPASPLTTEIADEPQRATAPESLWEAPDATTSQSEPTPAPPIDTHAAEVPETVQHLVVNQAVETDVTSASAEEAEPKTPPQSEEAAPDTLHQPKFEDDPSQPIHTPTSPHSAKTIDELLAETGAPDLQPAHEPPHSLIVSHHKSGPHHTMKWILITLLVLILIAVVLDILLDGGFLTTHYNIPHTNFF